MRRILYVRVTLICLAFAFIVTGGVYYYVTRTSDRLDRNNAKLIRVNADLKSTNIKLQHTLDLVTDNGNRAACSIRGALETARSRTIIGKKAAVTPDDKAKAQKAINDYTDLINAQRTVPLDFKCSTLIPATERGSP